MASPPRPLVGLALGAEVVIAVDLGWGKLGYYRERARPMLEHLPRS